MTAIRGHFLLRFYGELPEEAQAADDAFDGMSDRVLEVLNGLPVFGAGIVAESFSIEDGDTEPDE